MLVLSRKIGETIRTTIDGEIICIKVLRVQGGRVKLGITAPPNVGIARSELPDPRIADCNKGHGRAKLTMLDSAPSGSG